MSSPWYEIENIDKIDSPALVVYKDRVKINIQTALRMVGDPKRLRPHIKTHKSRDVSKLMLEAGITKFKSATIAEAEMLADGGAPDVLLAYPICGPKIDRFLKLMQKFPQTQFSCLADNSNSTHTLREKALRENTTITVFVDLNVGMNRTGVSPDEEAFRLIRNIRDLDGLHFGGLHAYDGHIHDTDMKVRTEKVRQSYAPVADLVTRLKSSGIESVVIAGGTPGFPIHAERQEVECSPGTFVFWDNGYTFSCPEQNFLPAALVISRVISQIDENTYCLDLGHKSIASENPITKRVFFYNAPDLEFIGQSEEHLVVRSLDGTPLKIGDVLYGIPHHICPTVALYDHLMVIEDGISRTEWPVTARDRRITI